MWETAWDQDDADTGAFLAYNQFAPVSVMPIEGGPQSTGADTPWWAKPVTYALGRWIDSEFPVPFGVNDPSRAQVAVAANGQLYYRGLPAPTAAAGAINPLVMYGGLALLAWAAYAALVK